MRRALLLFAFCVLGLVLGYLATRVRQQTGAQADLVNLINRADKIVVKDHNVEGSPVLYESTDRNDLNALKDAIKIKLPEKELHCKCLGSASVYLYANGEKIGIISNQHSKNIRCNLWSTDVPIVDIESFLKWFDERKISGPRDEYESNVRAARESAEMEARWLNGMPESLKRFWHHPRADHSDVSDHRVALAGEIPNQEARILALFKWFGSGMGPWSRSPVWEVQPELLLFDYSTDDLLAALNQKELTNLQLEGAARLFAGWEFSKRRPNDLAKLGPALKETLLKHSLESNNEDKKLRAKAAFAQPAK